MRSSTRRKPTHELEALLAQIARGDGEAFEDFVHATIDLLRRVVRRYVSPDEIEEICSAVHYEVWKRAGDYHASRATVGAWLTVLARSRAIDHARKRRSDRETIPAELSCPRTPIATLVELREAIARAVRGLHRHEREVIECSVLDGRSHREVADALDLPLGTVKTRLRRAQRRLRALLRDFAPRGCSRVDALRSGRCAQSTA